MKKMNIKLVNYQLRDI